MAAAEEKKKKMIKVMSSDGETFEMTEAAASMSRILLHMIEDGCADGAAGIPLPNVAAKPLAKIIEYCTKHAAAAADDEDGSTAAAEELKRFDEELIGVDTDTLYHLLMAGNFMGVEGVLELAVQRTAELIRGKSPEEIRDTFKIVNDFTPEEEEEIIKENAWALHPSKVSDASGSKGWAELQEELLHYIVPLLGSFIDILAFAGTCHSWRAAFSSYPSKSAFRTLLPPLLVRPNVRVKAPSSSNGPRKLRSCQVIDLANRNTPLRCQIPQETLQKMLFAGSSHGQLICCRSGYCLVVDVFTGAEVSPPRLPFSRDHEEIYFCGTLTAPITAPNSHLLISNRSSLFDWPVGSDSWSELKLPVNRVDQIVEFNGQLIAVIEYKLYTLQLAPKLRLKKIKTLWWDDMSECPYLRPWLVVCDDMLLIVDHYITLSFGAPVNYRPYRLDMSAKPAKWVEVKKLENWALFIGGDARSPPFAFKNPESWGGRSNCLYYAHYSQPWSLHGLGDDADAVWDPTTDDNLVFKRNWYSQLQAFWVYPSMFYSDGDGQDINKMMSSDGEISSMAERAASLLRQLIEDGCAAAKPLAEMVEYCAKHAAGEAQGKEEEVLDGESSDEEETDILRLEASLMGRMAELIKDKDKPPEPSPENDPFHGFHSIHSFIEHCYTD
uniref:SKP1-like protein n=1 Tax=Oryza meridionalis TaxID=40149 RepID=A0A0E0DVS1_9ORYZ